MDLFNYEFCGGSGDGKNGWAWTVKQKTDTANAVLGCGKDRSHGKAKYPHKYNHHINH